MSSVGGIMPGLMTGAITAIIMGTAVWAWYRSAMESGFWYMCHSRVLFVTIINWALWKAATTFSLFSVGFGTVHPTSLELTERITTATMFVVCFAAFMGCWADVHLHGHEKHDAYRKSRAPWIIFYVTAVLSLTSGAIAVLIDGVHWLPPQRTLEVWTTIMGGLLITGSFVLGFILWKLYPPEESRAKKISTNIQSAGLFFVCICFALRERMVWIPTSHIGPSSYEQLTRFVYLASEWLAIVVMLIFTFPRATTASLDAPNSDLVHGQWKRVRLSSSISAAIGLISTIASGISYSLDKTRPGGISNSSINFYHAVIATGIAIALLTCCGSAGMLVNSFLKKTKLLKPIVGVLVALASIAAVFSFALNMSLLIALQPLSTPTPSLIVCAAVTSATTFAFCVLVYFSYRLSLSASDDSDGLDFVMDFVATDGQMEHYEQPNRELDQGGHTIRIFLTISLLAHFVWLNVYFIPSSNSNVNSEFSWGWIVPLVSILFVMLRLPFALFGYISTLVYRRDNYRLIAFLLGQTVLNVVGVGIVILQSVYWLCMGGRCKDVVPTHIPPLTPEQKACFVIATSLIILLILEGTINAVYFRWYRKVKARLGSLLREDINKKFDNLIH